jgi:hypothetical protein
MAVDETLMDIMARVHPDEPSSVLLTNTDN